MPAPSLDAMAKKAGISKAKAESLWDKAKDQAKGATLKDGSKIPGKEDSWESKHWAYVVGIWKKMAGMKESVVESMITALLNMTSSDVLLDVVTGDLKVRTFYDAGTLKIATLDDILVEPGIDTRVTDVLNLVNEVDWPVDHPLSDFEFEGALNDLHARVLKLANKEGYRKGRGDRKAQRTKLRRP